MKCGDSECQGRRPAAGGGRYREQLAMMKAMGFDDEGAAIAALRRAGGDVNRAINFMF